MVGKIHFFIDEQGEVQVSVEGAQGKQCETMTAPFEEVLGDVSKRTLKDSYFEGNLETQPTVSSGENES